MEIRYGKSSQKALTAPLMGNQHGTYPIRSPVDKNGLWSFEYVPPILGRAHSHFTFRSPAELEGDILKKKLDEKPPPRLPQFRSLLGTPASTLFPQRPSVEHRFSSSLNGPVGRTFHSSTIPSSSEGLAATQVHSDFSSRSCSTYHDRKSLDQNASIDHLPQTLQKRNALGNATSIILSHDSARTNDTLTEDEQSHKRLRFDKGDVCNLQDTRAPKPNHQPPAIPLDTYCRRSSSSQACLERCNAAICQSSRTPMLRQSLFGRCPLAGPPACTILPAFHSLPSAAPLSPEVTTQISVSAPGSKHLGSTSGTSTGEMIKLDISSGTKAQASFMCECCPRKPRRFETAEELHAHDAKKLWQCQHCKTRFKYKNDVKRHLNSLHVLSYSWSCSALSTYEKAFHSSTNGPYEADICGYCGYKFSRSGRGPGTAVSVHDIPPQYLTDQDRELRIRHLQVVHSFRRCDPAKRFFRADHFRQHLKLMHRGTFGDWTKMLENACMSDESLIPQ